MFDRGVKSVRRNLTSHNMVCLGRMFCMLRGCVLYARVCARVSGVWRV